MVHMEEARHREVERPFDPEAARESYASPHHFAVNPMPGRRRFMVVKPERDHRTGALTGRPTNVLISSRAHGFMSLEEARAWAEDNDVGPFNVVEYVAGSEQDPRSRFEPNAGPRSEVDRHAATELVMYIENTADLSPDGPSGQGRSVLLNALRKFRKGTYDPKLAVRLFEYLTESGARRYVQENRSSLPWNQMFNVPTRRDAARQLEESFRSAAEHGEYDSVDSRVGAR
jgi:hypothetical protein